MSNYLTYFLKLPNVAVLSFSQIEDSICIHIELANSGINCPHCNSYTTEINQRPVLVKDLPAEGNPIYLRVPRRQFYCARCQRYLTERLSGLTANADILADMNQIFTSELKAQPRKQGRESEF